MRKALTALVLTFALAGCATIQQDTAQGTVNMTCMNSLSADVASIVRQQQSGVPYYVTRHLILTDYTNKGEGRWGLMQVLDRLESGELKPEMAHTFLWGLCTVELGKWPSTLDKDRKRLAPEEEGGEFWAPKRELRDT